MYGTFKDYILRSFDTSPQMLHIVLGISLYCLCLAITRRPFLSLFVVFCVQGGNELLDAREDLGRGRTLSMREIVSDTAWTVGLPILATALIALLRARTRWPRRP